MSIISSGQNVSVYNIRSGNNLPPGGGTPPTNKISSSPPSETPGVPFDNTAEIDLSKYTLQEFPGSPQATLPQALSPQEYQSQLNQQGDVRQTGLIKENGEIIGTISDKGITSFANSVGQAMHRAGLNAESGIDVIQSFLNKEYGGSISVEEFSPVSGPTYSEVHNSVHNDSYDSLVAQQTQEYQKQNNNWRLIDTTA